MASEDKENAVPKKRSSQYTSPGNKRTPFGNLKKCFKIGKIVQNNLQNLNPEEIEKDWKTPQTKN